MGTGPKFATSIKCVMVSSFVVICIVGLTVGVALLVIGSDTPFSPVSPSRLGKFRTAAVSTDGVPCSDIGRDVMLDGGNAMDAAIAALFCIGVVHPQSAGIGGGFLMTVYDSNTRRSDCLDAREVAPLKATEDMFHGNESRSQKGPLSVAVPGELAGYWEAHRKYGKLEWSRLVKPSALLARKGVRVNRHMANALKQEAKTIENEPSMWEFVNRNTGRVLEEGDILIRSRFAETLQLIATYGADILYNGTLGDELVSDIQQLGGIITKMDLQQYRPIWYDAVKADLNDDLTYYSMPPPGSGVLAAFVLNILDEYRSADYKGVNPADSSDPLVYHRMSEAFKHAYAQRTKLGDPQFDPQLNQLTVNLTSEELARQVFAKINDSTTCNDPNFYGAVTYDPDDHGTSHVCVLDRDGFAVAVTTTVNLYFGAGLVSSRTGIVLNDEMDDFSSPNVTSYFGIPASPANFIKPGKRPLSSMAPSVVASTGSGRVRLVIGAAGGTKITTAITYALIRNVWFGETIKEAIDSRRMHHQLFPMAFQYEPGFPKEIVQDMKNRGHQVKALDSFGAALTAISVEKDGFIYANSDFRKTGDVAGIDQVN